jgi:hypothetical protein
MDGSTTQAPSTSPTAFAQADAPQAPIDSIAACWMHSTKPRMRRWSAARHASAVRDVRMLKVRVRAPHSLSAELIDWGAGHSYSARGLECALKNPAFAFTPSERSAVLREVDSDRALELTCRAELAAFPAWADLAKRSSWNELAQEAARRERIA